MLTSRTRTRLRITVYSPLLRASSVSGTSYSISSLASWIIPIELERGSPAMSSMHVKSTAYLATLHILPVKEGLIFICKLRANQNYPYPAKQLSTVSAHEQKKEGPNHDSWTKHWIVIKRAKMVFVIPEAPCRRRWIKVAITMPVVVRPRPIWQLKTSLVPSSTCERRWTWSHNNRSKGDHAKIER